MTIIRTSDYMKPDVWTDCRTRIEYHDEEYYGPGCWAEQDKEGKILLCAITWDDMWLVAGEIRSMIKDIEALPEREEHGAAWQHMRVVWREDIEHYVMEVPTYQKVEIAGPEEQNV